jgi:hypothetical protein
LGVLISWIPQFRQYTIIRSHFTKPNNFFIIGSASATTKLATDGTLSEGTAQIEDRTLSTLVSAIPSTDLIKNAAGIKIAATAPTSSYELKIEEKAVKFSGLITIRRLTVNARQMTIW